MMNETRAQAASHGTRVMIFDPDSGETLRGLNVPESAGVAASRQLGRLIKDTITGELGFRLYTTTDNHATGGPLLASHDIPMKGFNQ